VRNGRGRVVVWVRVRWERRVRYCRCSAYTAPHIQLRIYSSADGGDMREAVAADESRPRRGMRGAAREVARRVKWHGTWRECGAAGRGAEDMESREATGERRAGIESLGHPSNSASFSCSFSREACLPMYCLRRPWHQAVARGGGVAWDAAPHDGAIHCLRRRALAASHWRMSPIWSA